jgi:hypothetical protein
MRKGTECVQLALLCMHALFRTAPNCNDYPVLAEFHRNFHYAGVMARLRDHFSKALILTPKDKQLYDWRAPENCKSSVIEAYS